MSLNRQAEVKHYVPIWFSFRTIQPCDCIVNLTATTQKNVRRM